MQFTTNLNLKKPDGTDLVNIADLNGNADIIDAETTKKATQTADGRMSKEDKTKLDGIQAGAQANTVLSVAGKTGAVTLSGTDVPQATTSARGTVQLTNGLTSTSTTTAVTAAQAKVLKDMVDTKAKKYWIDITEFGAVPNSDSSNAIQAAINSANAGDVVFIPTGVFILDKTIQLKSGIKLYGAASSSVLKMKDGANLAQMIHLPPNTTDYNFAIELWNFQIDGNKSNNTTGGHGILLNTTYKAFVKDIKVSNVKGKGIYFSGNAQKNTNTNYVKDCVVYGCDQEGVYFDEYCSDMHIYGGDYGYSRLDNVKMSSPSSSIRNCTVWGSREGSGLHITSHAPSLQVMNNQLEGNAKHGVEIHASHIFIEGNKIYDNSEYGNANLYSGVYISSLQVVLKNITINNNKIYSGLYVGNGIHKHAIEFADENHTNASIFGNSMKYTGNDVVDYSREIVKGLKIGEDASDYSWINSYFATSVGTPQLLTGGVWEKLKFDAVFRDIEGEFENSKNRFTAKNTGYYQFDLHVMLQNQTSKLVMLEFWVNDTVKYRVSCEKTVGNSWYTVNGSLLLSLAKGDSISAHIYCESGDETFSGTVYTRFTGKVVR